LSDVDLQRAYKSSVDPRLNYEQSLELALRLAGRSVLERRPARQRAS
jgi:3-deoxy-7-phosphoheptulonate synthase